MSRIKMENTRYAGVIALRDIGSEKSGDRKWLFACDCGQNFESNGHSVRSGKVISCPTCSAKRSRAGSMKHGQSESREFATWTDMQTRCYNANTASYKYYGGRGIKICDRWLESFTNFLLDMGVKPSPAYSIERNDVNGDYSPSNCRWATMKEQSRNKRNNRMIEINGVKKLMCDWSEQSGISVTTISLRLKAGVIGQRLLGQSKRDGCLEFNGVRDTFKGWSKRTGIKSSTIAMRVGKYQWPIEIALTKGATS